MQILLRLYQRVRQAAFSIVGSTIQVLEAPADTTGKFLLKLRINLYGATTMLRYKNVCANCEKREGKKKGVLSPIDFKTTSDMILPQDGKLRIDFIFAATRRPTDWGMANICEPDRATIIVSAT